MLAKSERFNTTDLSNLKTQKFKKIIVKYGFFVVYQTLLPGEKGKKGIMISKKVFKTAVLRNKYKRLFYNTVREVGFLKKQSFIFHPKKIFTKEDLMQDLQKNLPDMIQ